MRADLILAKGVQGASPPVGSFFRNSERHIDNTALIT
jgi:hypothetical protein